MPEKNKSYEAVITDLSFEGNGICKVDGMTVFVPNTAVGDKIKLLIVKLLKSYAFGKLEEIIVPSEERTEPDCENFHKCGGCIFRHINYKSECKIKSDIVKNAFVRIGGIQTEFEDFLGCEQTERYRNKAQYPIAEINGKAVCGFYAPRSHRVIPLDDCKLQPHIFSEICADVLNYINEHKISVYNEEKHNGFIRHLYIRQGFHSKEIMVCIVARKDISRELKALVKILTEKYTDIKSLILNINPDKTNVILGKKCITLAGNDFIIDTMRGKTIEISPLSFYQVNTSQAEKLYSIAEEYAQLNNDMCICDLYCGAGTIGLSMSDKVKKLIGIEIVPQAIENAKKNAAYNNADNTEFICAGAEAVSDALKKSSMSPEVIILDPPRKGCDRATIDAVVGAAPERIVMISCNPSTAARDCAEFEKLGYKVNKVRGVDMFPRTGHVETVVLLSHKEVETTIDVKLEFGVGKGQHSLKKAQAKADKFKPKERVTYKMIQEYVENKYGFKVHTAYIAEVKRSLGLEMYDAPNAVETLKNPRKHPTLEKIKAIKDALKYFEVI